MKSLFIAFAITAITVFVGQIKSRDALSVSWAIAYGVFCAPFLGVWVASRVFHHRYFIWPLVAICWFFVAIWCAMLISKDTFLVMPASAFAFGAISVAAIFLAFTFRGVGYIWLRLHRT